MKSKNRLFILIAAIGIFCCGCASGITEESPISEVNEENIGSESIEKANNAKQENYDESCPVYIVYNLLLVFLSLILHL